MTSLALGGVEGRPSFFLHVPVRRAHGISFPLHCILVFALVCRGQYHFITAPYIRGVKSDYADLPVYACFMQILKVSLAIRFGCVV